MAAIDVWLARVQRRVGRRRMGVAAGVNRHRRLVCRAWCRGYVHAFACLVVMVAFRTARRAVPTFLWLVEPFFLYSGIGIVFHFSVFPAQEGMGTRGLAVRAGGGILW